ncbi:hypothetical protein OG216_00050 [Streptomycetaceae bacterium NBC_01309]
MPAAGRALSCVYTSGGACWLYGLPANGAAAEGTGLSVAAATFHHDADQAPAVWQFGPRALWDDVEAAHAW